LSHSPLVPPLRGFARAAEVTEMNILSIAVERTAMESHSAADAEVTDGFHKGL